MKYALALIVLAVAIYLVRRRSRAQSATSSKFGSLEEKLETLAKCGITLAPSFTTDDLLESWSRDEYENEGYELLLVALGSTKETEPFRNRCTNLWHFDTECIEDDGDYKRIAERMLELSDGVLRLQDIRDHVDVEGEQAWLSFEFNDRTIKIECKVQHDWVDESVFGRFVEILKEADPTRVFIYHDLGGQDCILGCVSRNNFEKLKGAGIPFVPLR